MLTPGVYLRNAFIPRWHSHRRFDDGLLEKQNGIIGVYITITHMAVLLKVGNLSVCRGISKEKLAVSAISKEKLAVSASPLLLHMMKDMSIYL